MAAYRGANDEKIRLENESLLLEFIQSEASLDARREACMWLANLATKRVCPHSSDWLTMGGLEMSLKSFCQIPWPGLSKLSHLTP